MNVSDGLNQNLQQYSPFRPSQQTPSSSATTIAATFSSNATSNSNIPDSAYLEYINVTSKSSPEILFQPIYLTYLWLALIIGLPGNLLISAVYVTIKQKRTSDWFIFFLAVYDCAVCVFAIPLYLSIETGVWLSTGSDIACKLEQFIIHASQLSSVSILGIIAVDRFLKICHPTKRSLNATQARNIGLWTPVISGLAATPILIWEGNVDKRTCMVQDRYRNNWGVKSFVFLTFFFFVFMFTVVTFCYAKVIVVVKRRALRHKENTLKRKHLMEIPDFLRAISSVEETKKSQRKNHRSRRKFSLFSFTSNRRLSVISPWSKARLSLPNENSTDLKEHHEMNEIEKKATRESLTESKKLLDKALSAKSGLDTRSTYSDKERGGIRGERAASFGSRSKELRRSIRPRLMATCSVVSIDEQESNKHLTNKGPSKTSLEINANVEENCVPHVITTATNNQNVFKSVSKTSLVIKDEIGIRETKSKNSLVLNVNDMVNSLNPGRPSRRRSHALGVSDAYTQSWTQKHDALWSEQLKRARSNPNASIPRDTSDEFKDLAVSRVSMFEPDSTGFEFSIPLLSGLPCNPNEPSVHSTTKAIIDHAGDSTLKCDELPRDEKKRNTETMNGKSKRRSKNKSEKNPTKNGNKNDDFHQTENTNGDVPDVDQCAFLDLSTHDHKTHLPGHQSNSELTMSDYKDISGFHISDDSSKHNSCVGDRSSCRLMSLPEALQMSWHSCDENEENVTESTSFLQGDCSSRRKNSEPSLKSRTKNLRKYFSFTSTAPSKKGSGENSESKGLYKTLRSIHNSIKRRRSKGKKSSLPGDIEVNGDRIKVVKDEHGKTVNQNGKNLHDECTVLEGFNYEDERGSRSEVNMVGKQNNENYGKINRDGKEEDEKIKPFQVNESSKDLRVQCTAKIMGHIVDDVQSENNLGQICNIASTRLDPHAEQRNSKTQYLQGVYGNTPCTNKAKDSRGDYCVSQSNAVIKKEIRDIDIDVSQHFNSDDNHYCRHGQREHDRDCNCNCHQRSPLLDTMQSVGEKMDKDGLAVHTNKSCDGGGIREGSVGFVGDQRTGTVVDGVAGGLGMMLMVPRDCGERLCSGAGVGAGDGGNNGMFDCGGGGNGETLCGSGDGVCTLVNRMNSGGGASGTSAGSGDSIHGSDSVGFDFYPCDNCGSDGCVLTEIEKRPKVSRKCVGGSNACVCCDRKCPVGFRDGSPNSQTYSVDVGSAIHSHNDNDAGNCDFKAHHHRFCGTNHYDQSITQHPIAVKWSDNIPTLTPRPSGNNSNNSSLPDRPTSINRGKLLLHENNDHPSRHITLRDRAGKNGSYGASACQSVELNLDQPFNVEHQSKTGVPIHTRGDFATSILHNAPDPACVQMGRISRSDKCSCNFERGCRRKTFPPTQFRRLKTGNNNLVHGRCYKSNSTIGNSRIDMLSHKQKIHDRNPDPPCSPLNTNSLYYNHQPSSNVPQRFHHGNYINNGNTSTQRTDTSFGVSKEQPISNPRIELAITNKHSLCFTNCLSYACTHSVMAVCLWSVKHVEKLSARLSTKKPPCFNEGHEHSTLHCDCFSCCIFAGSPHKIMNFYIDLQRLLAIYNPLTTKAPFTTTNTAAINTNSNPSTITTTNSTTLNGSPPHDANQPLYPQSKSEKAQSGTNPNQKSQYDPGLDLRHHVSDKTRSLGPELITSESYSTTASLRFTSSTSNTERSCNPAIVCQQFSVQQFDSNVAHNSEQIRTNVCLNEYRKQPPTVLFQDSEGEFGFHSDKNCLWRHISDFFHDIDHQKQLEQNMTDDCILSQSQQIATYDYCSLINTRIDDINTPIMKYTHATLARLPSLSPLVCHCPCSNYVTRGHKIPMPACCDRIYSASAVWSDRRVHECRKYHAWTMDAGVWGWGRVKDVTSSSWDEYQTPAVCALSLCGWNGYQVAGPNEDSACIMGTNELTSTNRWTVNSLTFILSVMEAGKSFNIDTNIVNYIQWIYFCELFNIDMIRTDLPCGEIPSKGPTSVCKTKKRCNLDNETVVSERVDYGSNDNNENTDVNNYDVDARISISQESNTLERRNLWISDAGKSEDNGEKAGDNNNMRIGGFQNARVDIEGFAGNFESGKFMDKILYHPECEESNVCDKTMIPLSKSSDNCAISTNKERALDCLGSNLALLSKKSLSDTFGDDFGLTPHFDTPEHIKTSSNKTSNYSKDKTMPYIEQSDLMEGHSKPQYSYFNQKSNSNNMIPSDRCLTQIDNNTSVTIEIPQENTTNALGNQQNMSTLLLSVPIPGLGDTSSLSKNEYDRNNPTRDVTGSSQTNTVPSLLISQTDVNTSQTLHDTDDIFPVNEDLHLLNVGKLKKRASSWSVTGAKTSNVQRFTPFDKIHSSLLGCLPTITAGSGPEKGSMPAIHVPKPAEDTCQIFARSVIGAFFSSGKSSCASDPCLQLNDEEDFDGIKVTTPSTEEILEAMKRSEEYVTKGALGENLHAGDGNNELGAFPQRRHSSFQTYCKTIGRFGRLARRANGRITHSWYSLDDLQDNCPGKIPSRSVTKLAYLATIGSQIQEAFSMKNVKRVFSTNLFKSLSRHLDHIPGTKKSFPRGHGQEGRRDSPITCNHIDVIITRCESIVMDGSQVSLDRSNGYGGTYDTYHSTEDNHTEVHTSNESSATNTTTHNQHANISHQMRASHSFASGADTPISSLSRSDDQSIMSRSHDTSIDRLRGVSLDLLSPMSASVRGSVCSGLSSLSKATECSAYTENSRSDCEKITRRSAEREHNITKLLGVITLIFVVSWSVSWSVNLMYLAVAITDTPRNHVILSLGQNMFLMNHFCNIFFYTFFSKSFREKLTNFYNERSKKCHNHDNPSITTSRSIRN